MKAAVNLTALDSVALTASQKLAGGSPTVEHDTQKFLNALKAGGGPPIETLAPTDARAVLAGVQASVKLTLPLLRLRRRRSAQTGATFP
jgi:hypothetical protein